MAYSRINATDRAMELVKAGLTSGTIKLQGSSNYPDNNQSQIRADSAYLTALITAIADSLVNLKDD